MSTPLRTLLEEMTADPRAIGDHPGRLFAIAAEAPHTITVVFVPGDEPLAEYNCVMYALGIVARLEHASTPLKGEFYADTRFLLWLIEEGVLRATGAVPGAIVTWSSGGVIKHAGILVSAGRADSKWGIGHVYEHGLLELPESYGDELAFYSPVGADLVLDRLRDYLAHPRRG